MLSRDAEHLYWLTRYVERIENTARMINVHSELMLDFPGDQSLGWKPIIETMDSKKFFKKRYSEYSEISAVKFLGDDKENLNSIISSLEMARYNARALKMIFLGQQQNNLIICLMNLEEEWLLHPAEEKELLISTMQSQERKDFLE
tara:strand:- start:477 stop:914 length:438 start_codon:yes stop_codon:yes gene_type:complete